MRVVQFIDTSVFVEYLDVPGHNANHNEIADEMIRRAGDGVTFILPITTIIETGNHIEQCGGGRRAAAERFVEALQAARQAKPPWMVRDVAWNSEFLQSFINGNPTAMSLLDHLSNATLGSGDVAILAEREQFRASISPLVSVEIWSLDKQLSAYS